MQEIAHQIPNDFPFQANAGQFGNLSTRLPEAPAAGFAKVETRLGAAP